MLKKIAPDKWRHFWAGIVLGSVLQAVLWWLLPAHPVASISAAFFLVVAFSYGFEVFSKITGKGHYDVWDAVASTLGGVAGIALVMIAGLWLCC